MRVDFCGLPLDALTMAETVDRITDLVARGGAHQHVVLNAAKVVAASDDPALADLIRDCAVVNADGMSIVWAARFLGRPVPERVPGIELFEALLGEAERRHWPVYLLGARSTVLEAVVTEARRRHPGLVVAGHRDGYWSAEEEVSVVHGIRDSGARLVFVAIPSPQKERFLKRYLPSMGEVVGVGVGGSFDVMAGVTRRAPAWMGRAGLEWAFRLAQEPRRMARRYLVGNPRFVWLVMRHRWSGQS